MAPGFVHQASTIGHAGEVCHFNTTQMLGFQRALDVRGSGLIQGDRFKGLS